MGPPPCRGPKLQFLRFLVDCAVNTPPLVRASSQLTVKRAEIAEASSSFLGQSLPFGLPREELAKLQRPNESTGSLIHPVLRASPFPPLPLAAASSAETYDSQISCTTLTVDALYRAITDVL